MIEEAVECEASFADDVLSEGVVGLTRIEMRQYLQYVADQRLDHAGPAAACTATAIPSRSWSCRTCRNSTNFFERKVSAYQVAVQGEVAFDHAF